MDINPDHFLSEVHNLDYSIVGPNKQLNRRIRKIRRKKNYLYKCKSSTC